MPKGMSRVMDMLYEGIQSQNMGASRDESYVEVNMKKDSDNNLVLTFKPAIKQGQLTAGMFEPATHFDENANYTVINNGTIATLKLTNDASGTIILKANSVASASDENLKNEATTYTFP